MSTIAIHTRRLPLSQKLVRGRSIITQSMSNPNVPGNESVLARSSPREKKTARETALQNWTDAPNALATYTERATGGDAYSVESAGFGVKARRTPTPSLPPPAWMMAKMTGRPGTRN